MIGTTPATTRALLTGPGGLGDVRARRRTAGGGIGAACAGAAAGGWHGAVPAGAGPSIVTTIHDLFTQQPVSSSIWTALAWCLGILIVAYALAMATYHRKIA
jgi:hypothetical protein